MTPGFPEEEALRLKAFRLCTQIAKVQSAEEITLKNKDSENEDSEIEIQGVFQVNANVPTLNIRKTPSLQSEILGKTHAGELHEFLEIKDGWYRIQLSDEGEAWVMGRYVFVEKQ